MVHNTPFPLWKERSGCLTTLKQELDLRGLLTDAEGCRDFVFPPHIHPPKNKSQGAKGISAK